MSDLKADIARIVKGKLGESPSVELVIDVLYEGGAVTDKTLRANIITHEFFRLMAKDSARTARDIELELSTRYEVDQTLVRYLRNKHITGGRRRKCVPGNKGK